MSEKDLGYLLNLRKVVGHRPLVVACSVALVFNDKHEVLLEKRADDQMLDFPGGSIELNEEASQTAKRELLEETGLTADSLTLFNVYDIVYLVNKVSGELKKQEDEVLNLSYYQLEKIPKNLLSPRNQKIIADLIAYTNKRKKR